MTSSADRSTTEHARVVIIGGGITARAACDALLQLGVKPDEILVVEEQEEPKGVGSGPLSPAGVSAAGWGSLRRRFTGVRGVRQDDHRHGLIVDIAGGVIRARNIVVTFAGPTARLSLLKSEQEARRLILRHRVATDVPGLFLLTADSSRFSSLRRDGRAIARRVEGRP